MKLLETYSDINNSGKYDEFIREVKWHYGPRQYRREIHTTPNLDLILTDLIDYIEKSEVKSISIENLKGAAGMAHYDKMILNDQIFFRNFCYFLYVVLHETSHYYQFKKHGTVIGWDAFNKDDIDEIVDHLLKIEVAADRLALRKFRDMKNKYGLKCNEPVQHYGSIKKNDFNYKQVKGYVQTIKNKMKEENITNNTELVDLIYNTVK